MVGAAAGRNLFSCDRSRALSSRSLPRSRGVSIVSAREKVQHRLAEHDRILKEREMTDLGEDQLAATRSQSGHVISVLPLDRLIVIRVDDPCGHRDVTQFLVGKIRLARPQLLYVCAKSVVLRGGRRESRILRRGAMEKSCEHGALA